MRTEWNPRAWMCLPLFASSALAQVETVPPRTENNIIVAAYNIQFMGESKHDYGKLAKVIQHFDVCGILELKNERALPDLVKALNAETGKDWGYAFGVRTHRPGGRYHEAYGAVWRRDRVELGDGLIGGLWDLEEAFRNDPYWVSFRRKGFDFTLLLLHTRWSADEEGSRETEIAMLAEQVVWMRGFLPERDIILAGDFNYPGTHKAMRDMAEAAGLLQLDADPLSTFKADGSGYASAYDHIYAPDSDTPEYVANSCHTLDVTKFVYGNREPANMKKARSELSDHLPVFAVFDVSAEDDD